VAESCDDGNEHSDSVKRQGTSWLPKLRLASEERLFSEELLIQSHTCIEQEELRTRLIRFASCMSTVSLVTNYTLWWVCSRCYPSYQMFPTYGCMLQHIFIRTELITITIWPFTNLKAVSLFFV
jgi:hypothetical protein